MTEEASQPDGEVAEDLGLDGFLQPSDDDGLSLDELSQAYADLLKQGEDPYVDTEEPSEPTPEAASQEPEVATLEEEDAPEEEDETRSRAHDISPRSIVEAILFVGTPDGSPLTSDEIAALMRGVRPQEVSELVQELNQRYEDEGCPYHIVPNGPGFQLILRERFASIRNKFYGRVRDAKLSQAAIDVLAVVAYKQPVTRDDVDQMRAKPSSSLLSQLVRRNLLAVRRDEEKPKVKQYVTTERFLDLFGMQSLSDLPTSQQPDR